MTQVYVLHVIIYRGPFHLPFFMHNPNLMQDWFCVNSLLGNQITTEFCTCHDSKAVMACAKFCSDHCIRIWMISKWNFYTIELQWKNSEMRPRVLLWSTCMYMIHVICCWLQNKDFNQLKTISVVVYYPIIESLYGNRPLPDCMQQINCCLWESTPGGCCKNSSCGISWVPLAQWQLTDFAECISLKLLEGFSLFEVLWNCQDLKLCNIMVICPFAPYGLYPKNGMVD